MNHMHCYSRISILMLLMLLWRRFKYLDRNCLEWVKVVCTFPILMSVLVLLWTRLWFISGTTLDVDYRVSNWSSHNNHSYCLQLWMNSISQEVLIPLPWKNHVYSCCYYCWEDVYGWHWTENPSVERFELSFRVTVEPSDSNGDEIITYSEIIIISSIVKISS